MNYLRGSELVSEGHEGVPEGLGVDLPVDLEGLEGLEGKITLKKIDRKTAR